MFLVSCLLACVEHLRNLSCFLRFSTLWVCSGSVQNDTLKSVARDFSTYSPTSRMCVRSSGEQLRPAQFRDLTTRSRCFAFKKNDDRHHVVMQDGCAKRWHPVRMMRCVIFLLPLLKGLLTDDYVTN